MHNHFFPTDEFRNFFVNSDFHVIAVSETWLKSNISDDVVLLEDFNILRYDRNGKRGGGVAAYCRKYLCARILRASYDFYCNKPEYLLVEIAAPSATAILVGVVYRPPKVDHL